MPTPLAQRLHHTAYVTKDQEATRAFYEDVLGFPLLATSSEADELFGAVRVYCHTFFGLADGSALAFFQFADPADQATFDPELTPSPFRHIAMKVDAEGPGRVERRREEPADAGPDVRPGARLLPVALRPGPVRHAPRVPRRRPAGRRDRRRISAADARETLRPLARRRPHHATTSTGERCVSRRPSPHHRQRPDAWGSRRRASTCWRLARWGAVFFAVGRNAAYPAGRRLLERALAEGHLVGSHTWSHIVTFGGADDAAVDRELDDGRRAVADAGGDPHLFRPYAAGGAIDDRLMSPHGARRLLADGCPCVLWNSVPGDWLDPAGWPTAALADVDRQPWTVTVLHDVADASLDRLDDFVAQCADGGMSFTGGRPGLVHTDPLRRAHRVLRPPRCRTGTRPLTGGVRVAPWKAIRPRECDSPSSSPRRRWARLLADAGFDGVVVHDAPAIPATPCSSPHEDRLMWRAPTAGCRRRAHRSWSAGCAEPRVGQGTSISRSQSPVPLVSLPGPPLPTSLPKPHTASRHHLGPRGGRRRPRRA